MNRAYLFASVILLAMGLLAGCQTSQSEEERGGKPGTVQAQESSCDWDVSYEVMAPVQRAASSFLVLINGFPVYAEGARGPGGGYEISAPLNTGLIDGKNELLFELEPRLLSRGGESLSIGSAEWSARVLGCANRRIAEIPSEKVDSVYEAWVRQAREQWTDYRSRVEESAIDSMRAWASRHPMTVSVRFENEHGPDFSRVFEEAPRLADTPATRRRLKDYAMQLRDWMAEKDTSALFEAFRFRYAQEYVYSGVDGSVSEDSLFLRKALVMEKPELDFIREEVGLRRWADGRVWEIYRDGADAFFEGAEGIREVYVAEIDGELKVVR